MTITLVGKRIASVGNQFVFSGKTDECRECTLRKVCCDKLEAERVYVIVDVRERFHTCPLHEEGVQLVEVEEASMKITVPSQQLFEGAVFTFHPIACNQWNCPNNEACNPQGLYEGDRVHIEKILQKSGIKCTDNRRLGCALVRRMPS
jgi:uncharacterized protein (UPF0179 family)